MSGNTFGTLFQLTTFGESHGPAVGGVVDGCPAGIPINEAIIQTELDRRKPGQGGIAATARQEADAVRLLSGVFEGVTTGTPIGFLIENQDQRSRDYSKIMDVYRPGHADLTFDAKFGLRDYRGGGRSSGRETVSRVAGGAIAQELLGAQGIHVQAACVELGGIPATANRCVSALMNSAISALSSNAERPSRDPLKAIRIFLYMAACPPPKSIVSQSTLV